MHGDALTIDKLTNITFERRNKTL